MAFRFTMAMLYWRVAITGQIPYGLYLDGDEFYRCPYFYMLRIVHLLLLWAFSARNICLLLAGRNRRFFITISITSVRHQKTVYSTDLLVYRFHNIRLIDSMLDLQFKIESKPFTVWWRYGSLFLFTRGVFYAVRKVYTHLREHVNFYMTSVFKVVYL